jgi:hypothetical protein
MCRAFEIKILDQGWLEGCQPEEDLCSHGRVSLIIAGTKIAEESDEFGISESALAMLRTLRCNHSPESPVAERMLFHGCGAILMMGCPIGINWRATHCDGEIVRIDDVIWYPNTNEAHAIRYPGLSIDLSFSDYRDKVSAFAREAEGLFCGIEKRIDGDFDKKQYKEFWKEYHELLK